MRSAEAELEKLDVSVPRTTKDSPAVRRRRPARSAAAVAAAFSAFVACAACATAAPRMADRPNIILLLADDLASSDPACYGHPWHETPHLDSLARQGMRFTNGYAPAPICSASRAATLTGRTTARFEVRVRDEVDARVSEDRGRNTARDSTLCAESPAGGGDDSRIPGRSRLRDGVLRQVAPERASPTLPRLESRARPTAAGLSGRGRGLRKSPVRLGRSDAGADRSVGALSVRLHDRARRRLHSTAA